MTPNLMLRRVNPSREQFLYGGDFIRPQTRLFFFFLDGLPRKTFDSIF